MDMQANIVEAFSYRVQVIAHCWVPLHDGIRLSAKLWVPQVRTPREKFPVILEAIPYRKDDICLEDDSVRMSYFAGNGYICARLDLRGSGDSEGVLTDEYSEQEQEDICEVIQWLANLDQSNGNVGMTGISWSGFNSLQVAAKCPPALKAVITVCSTDDRYDNDVHYMGGSPLAFYMNWWGAIMHEFDMRPPDPAVVGDAWEKMWRERLAQNTHLSDKWLCHQRRDEYWRIGSICENYHAVKCPVLAVGGWADGYTDSILRMLDHLDVCIKAIIGPWGHTWPERPVPGPAIGFLQECLRWWDHWLKGVDNGAQRDPAVRYYLQDACALTPDLAYRPGRWMQTESLAKRNSRKLSFAADGKLCAHSDGKGGSVSLCSPLVCGTQVDTWLPMGSNIDLPSEQTPDDERSACFDTVELEESFEIVGQPIVRLRVASNKTIAFIFVRLCDVWPDGSSQLITRGNLNLTHRYSHEYPEPLAIGEFYDVQVPLKAVAQTVPAGHRIRISLSTSYWTWIWPSPEMATVTVDCSGSHVVLPMGGEQDVPLARPFEPAEIARGERPDYVPAGGYRCERTFDPASNTMTYRRWTNDFKALLTPSGMSVEADKVAAYRIAEGDPLSAHMETRRFERFSREGWEVELEVNSSMDCDERDFIIETKSRASYNGRGVLDETHRTRVPRDLN